VSEVAFFITGMGRSGTKWLSYVLDYDPAIKVHHEPVKRDPTNYDLVRRDKDYSGEKYLRWRAGEMVPPEGQRWAEVNSYLRYLVPDLRRVFPGVPIAGLVRDPRKTVRSLVARGIYSNPDYPFLRPPEELDTQFARCCWYWADTYELLLEWEVPIFRLEDLNDALSPAFQELCEMIGASVPSRALNKYRGMPINASFRPEIPLGFTEEEERTFIAIAGKISERLGYGKG